VAQSITARHNSGAGNTTLSESCLSPTALNRSVDRRGSGEKEGAVVDEYRMYSAYYLIGVVGDRMHMRIERKFMLLELMFEEAALSEESLRAA